MKKHIDILNVDISFLKWLLEKIRIENENIDNKEEIEQSVSNLINGTINTLMIETDGKETLVENDHNIIKCGDLIINSREHRVKRGEEEIFLTPKEFDILYFLAENKGVVFTKEQIYKAVWDKNYLLDDSNIMAFIRKIRKKIEVTPDAPEYIITIWGIGYKFNDNI